MRGTVENKVRALEHEAAAMCVRERDEESTEALRARLIRYEAYCERLADTPSGDRV